MPTLPAYEGLALEGSNFGLRPESAAKIETVRKGGKAALQAAKETLGVDE